MTTIKDYIKKCEFVKSNLMAEQQRIIEKNSKKIINLNKNQFVDGLGSDNKELFNTNKVYSGFYKSGQYIGQRYDFFNTGRFIQGLDSLYTDKKLRQDIAARGFARMQEERFRWKHVGQSFADVIEQVLTPQTVSLETEIVEKVLA